MNCTTENALQGRTCWPAVGPQAPAVAFFKVCLYCSFLAKVMPPLEQPASGNCKVGAVKALHFSFTWDSFPSKAHCQVRPSFLLVCLRVQLPVLPSPILSSFLSQTSISKKPLAPRAVCFLSIWSATAEKQSLCFCIFGVTTLIPRMNVWWTGQNSINKHKPIFAHLHWSHAIKGRAACVLKNTILYPLSILQWALQPHLVIKSSSSSSSHYAEWKIFNEILDKRIFRATDSSAKHKELLG